MVNIKVFISLWDLFNMYNSTREIIQKLYQKGMETIYYTQHELKFVSNNIKERIQSCKL